MEKLHIKEKGITLISLVITIIILLILAGISISQLAENGLLGKSKLAKEQSKRASIIEYINLKLNEIEIDNYDKTNDKFIQIANEEFKKEETINSLRQYGKEITISNIMGNENNKFFYITIDSKIYEVQRTGAIYKGESTEVEKPSIEIVSGTEGDNGYYRSNVKLMITQINTENLNTIKYKLEGAMTSEEKEIENGDTIEITEEGVTTITVASYDNTNNKSEDVKLEIKKDSIAPNIELADANPSAREYTKKIIANIKDDTSNVIYKAWDYGFTEVSEEFYKEFENDFSVNPGRLQIVQLGEVDTESMREEAQTYTVYAKDGAGNEAIKRIRLPNLLLTWSNGGSMRFEPMWYDDWDLPVCHRYEIDLKNLPKGKYKLIYEGNNLPALKDYYGGEYIANIDVEYINNPSKKIYTFEMIKPNEGPNISFENRTESEAYIEKLLFQEL